MDPTGFYIDQVTVDMFRNAVMIKPQMDAVIEQDWNDDHFPTIRVWRVDMLDTNQIIPVCTEFLNS